MMALATSGVAIVGDATVAGATFTAHLNHRLANVEADTAIAAVVVLPAKVSQIRHH